MRDIRYNLMLLGSFSDLSITRKELVFVSLDERIGELVEVVRKGGRDNLVFYLHFCGSLTAFGRESLLKTAAEKVAEFFCKEANDWSQKKAAQAVALEKLKGIYS